MVDQVMDILDHLFDLGVQDKTGGMHVEMFEVLYLVEDY